MTSSGYWSVFCQLYVSRYKGMVSPRAVKVSYSGLFDCQLYKQSLTVMVSPLVLRSLTKQFSCLIWDTSLSPSVNRSRNTFTLSPSVSRSRNTFTLSPSVSRSRNTFFIYELGYLYPIPLASGIIYFLF